LTPAQPFPPAKAIFAGFAVLLAVHFLSLPYTRHLSVPLLDRQGCQCEL
jgi:hypothetical protein